MGRRDRNAPWTGFPPASVLHRRDDEVRLEPPDAHALSGREQGPPLRQTKDRAVHPARDLGREAARESDGIPSRAARPRCPPRRRNPRHLQRPQRPVQPHRPVRQPAAQPPGGAAVRDGGRAGRLNIAAAHRHAASVAPTPRPPDV